MAIMLVAWNLNKEVAKSMAGHDNITVRLISIASKPTPKQEIKKPESEPVKITKPIQKLAIIKRQIKPEQKLQQPKSYQPQSRPEQKWQETKSDNSHATITYQPMPKIPDDLRREALSTYATVRFHVLENGNASAELITPSQNPRLNHILLETLKTWRFTPANDNGHPVASTFDIRVHFAVQ